MEKVRSNKTHPKEHSLAFGSAVTLLAQHKKDSCGDLFSCRCCSRRCFCISGIVFVALATIATALILIMIFGIPLRPLVHRFCSTMQNQSGFLCDDSVTCIQPSGVCNGVQDCPSGADEDPHMCSYVHLCVNTVTASPDSCAKMAGRTVLTGYTAAQESCPSQCSSPGLPSGPAHPPPPADPMALPEDLACPPLPTDPAGITTTAAWPVPPWSKGPFQRVATGLQGNTATLVAVFPAIAGSVPFPQRAVCNQANNSKGRIQKG
ncbi:hypothetical protein JZ751_015769 [Albula glossodonta]|uniref:Uncharacterized protein n=1 Tax=Albula glossodonta TaxID=121402 RepID=A0A8T2MWV0_9TELE|nr:hypothetical protein JZ751_015769 [Albula glossodonta]